MAGTVSVTLLAAPLRIAEDRVVMRIEAGGWGFGHELFAVP